MAPQRAGRDITKQMLRYRQTDLDQTDFKQKAEEKKMSMSKNIARLAVTAGLTAALSFGGVMAPVTMAFADGTTTSTNSIKINKNNANGDVKYKAYQIFKANVVDEDDNKVVSNIDWASGKAKDAVLGYLKTVPKSGITVNSTAQEAAKYLTDHSEGAGKTTAIENSNLFNGLAKAVEQGVDQTGAAFGSEIVFEPKDDKGNALQGYYLFVTDESTLGTEGKPEKNTGTSPIFAVVGGKGVTVTEKTSIPTVEKQVLEGGNWRKVSDSYIGEEVEYKLTGHVASNIATFKKYEYEFQDTLSKGLEVVKDSNDAPKDLHVYIDNKGTQTEVVQDDANGYKVTSGQDNVTKKENLTIAFTDLKTVKDKNGTAIKVDADSSVVVTYKAKLNSDVEYAANGTTNEVKLVYSNDPMSTGTGTSESKKVTDYVFGFDVTKTDPGNSSAQLVAGFTVKMTKEGSDKNVAKWLKQDGSFSNNENDAYTFETKETGNKVFIPGLVAGTYLISESKTPAGYNTIPDFEITVVPEYNTDGTLKKLNVTSSSNMATPTIEENVTTTKIPVTIENKKGSGLPLTGLNGVTFTWIAGGAVLCIGVAHLIRSRKQAEESEQE